MPSVAIQSALAESNRFDLAFASLPEPTLLLDECGNLEAINTAATMLLGESTSNAAHRKDHVQHALPWLEATVERVLADADEAGMESEIATPGGRRTISARLRRVRAQEGELRGVLVVLEDLTGRREFEAQQRSAERVAALGTLAAGLAHEVNNPLACVVAGLSFIEAEHERIATTLGPSELAEAKLAIEEAREAARRVGLVVRSLQRLGQPTTPFLVEVDASASLKEALEIIGPELLTRAHLTTAIDASVWVRASEQLLVDLFLALLRSVASAIPRGDALRHALHVTLDTLKEEAWVAVSDTALHEAKQVEEAFAPFLTHRQDGEGLVLSVGLGIATALGGALALGHVPGRGLTATVRLPLAQTTA